MPRGVGSLVGARGPRGDRPAAALHHDLADCAAEIVFAGHTHQSTDRCIGAVRAVNLGSVSNPTTDHLRAS